MMIKYDWLIYIVTVVVLSMIYVACFNVAESGYGYSGYRGYHHHHSFWYVRWYDESFNPSNRETSLDGNRFSHKGLSGGK